jgi:hypothetical protein
LIIGGLLGLDLKMDRNKVIEGTRLFTHRCVKLGLALPENALGRHVRSQLVKSSTSVAANCRAACLAVKVGLKSSIMSNKTV